MAEEKKEKNEEKSDLKSPIGEIELEACRLKFEGFNTSEIHERLVRKYGSNVPAERTILNWFWSKGRLGVFYKTYADAEAKMRREETKDLFRASVKEAVRKLVTLMRTSKLDVVQLGAAKEIINRELGEPLKVVADAGKDPATRILEEIGIIAKKESNDGSGPTENS